MMIFLTNGVFGLLASGDCTFSLLLHTFAILELKKLLCQLTGSIKWKKNKN